METIPLASEQEKNSRTVAATGSNAVSDEGNRRRKNFFTMRANEIEQQLAQLRWRRLQNERAIKDSLEASKVLRQKDILAGLAGFQSSEKSDWMTAIVADELSRPLVVTDEQVVTINEKDVKIRKRLEKYSKNQLANLDSLIHTLENRHYKTEEALQIRDEQLRQFRTTKQKLKMNIREIEEGAAVVASLKK